MRIIGNQNQQIKKENTHTKDKMVRLGNYDIEKQIGEGGFGRTYLGRHILNPRIKACLKQNLNISPEDEKLLMAEAQLMAKVNHHSLATFRDIYKSDDGSLVLVMSFVEGRTLDKIIEKHKAIHPEEVSWIAQRSLNALHYLHSEGIIHGDVKPSNIMVQPKKHNAVLIDYGLACIKPSSDSKAVGYTAVFAAPEITESKPPIPESDLYALGLTMLYAMGGDPLTKSYPDYVPKPLQDFCNELVRYNPVDRPNWKKVDLVRRLSDVRLESFGRRNSKG